MVKTIILPDFVHGFFIKFTKNVRYDLNVFNMEELGYLHQHDPPNDS